MKLSAGFIQYSLSGWSRYSRLLETIETALPLDPVPVQKVEHPVFTQAGITVGMLRMDQVHPIVSGNKGFKLRYNLAEALRQNAAGLISFGGAWSNHLHAFSYAGKTLGLKTRVIVRGEEWQTRSTPLLDDLRAWGTDIIPVSRQEYRLRNQRDYQRELMQRHPGYYLIPEGGDNFLGMLGMADLCRWLSPQARQYLLSANDVWVACGTGNSMVGLRLALPAATGLTGVSALKGDWYQAMIARKMAACWPLPLHNWRVFCEFHGGGFGKLPGFIKAFMTEFEQGTGIPLDPVYTGKLCYALVHLAKQGSFPRGQRLLVLHTGGLQGRRSLETDSQVRH